MARIVVGFMCLFVSYFSCSPLLRAATCPEMALPKDSVKVFASSFQYPVTNYQGHLLKRFGKGLQAQPENLGECLNVQEGTPVMPISDGRLVYYGRSSDYHGEVAVVEHDLGQETTFELKEGDGKVVTTRYLTSIYGNIRNSRNADGSGDRVYLRAGDLINKEQLLGFAEIHPPVPGSCSTLHVGLRLAEHAGTWAYCSSSNITCPADCQTRHFAAPSEILATLGAPQDVPKAVPTKVVAKAITDSAKPKVSKMGVSTSEIILGQEVTISYSVTDNSALKQVELWVHEGSNWKNSGKVKSASGKSASGSFTHTPSKTGTIKYGLHVVDKSGNWDSEGSAGPKSVTVKAADRTKPKVTKLTASPTSITLGQEVAISYTVTDDVRLKQVELWIQEPDSGWRLVAGKVDQASGTSSSGSFKHVPSRSGTFRYGLHVVDQAGNWDSEGSVGSKSVKVESKPVAGWSNKTGYRHAETAVQRRVIASISDGLAPLSVPGTPWQTDYAGDGPNMIQLIKEFDKWYRAQATKPTLPLYAVPQKLRDQLAAVITSGRGNTYTANDARQLVDRVARIYTPTKAIPTNEQETLSYLGMRAQCKEFADRKVVEASGKAKAYSGSATVAANEVRPGMYAFMGSAHAAIILAVEWDDKGKAKKYLLGESNWASRWNSPKGDIPWERRVITNRTVPAQEYRVVSTE